MSEVSRILRAIERGDRHEASRLLPLVYDELRKLARSKMAHERPGQTLGATGLVHEAYLRLIGNEADKQWDNRGHFFAAAAEAMRRILIENARRKSRDRHGGGRHRVEMSEGDLATSTDLDDLLALDEALARLAADDAQAAELAKLRCFAGLSVDEAADALGISRATAYRHWTYARAHLKSALQESE
jgi:RNA polymerase sigma factor (TIGR02999 family)